MTKDIEVGHVYELDNGRAITIIWIDRVSNRAEVEFDISFTVAIGKAHERSLNQGYVHTKDCELCYPKPI